MLFLFCSCPKPICNSSPETCGDKRKIGSRCRPASHEHGDACFLAASSGQLARQDPRFESFVRGLPGTSPQTPPSNPTRPPLGAPQILQFPFAVVLNAVGRSPFSLLLRLRALSLSLYFLSGLSCLSFLSFLSSLSLSLFSPLSLSPCISLLPFSVHFLPSLCLRAKERK